MRLVSRYDRASSGELIRASRRDPAAFAALYDRHALALRQWLYAQTRDRSVANELLSETFMVAWRGARHFRGRDEDSGGAWLYGIARNLVRNWRRHQRAEIAAGTELSTMTLAGEPDGFDPVAARIDARTLSESVRRAFAELTPEQQQAVGYRVLGELSYEELADRTKVNVGTARTRVHRGLLALRAAIDKGDTR